jgi:uncharacterized damage-inducible protein DinB
MTTPSNAPDNAASTAAGTATAVVITPGQLLAQWQGHRKLTRRVIEAFPDDALFQFSIGGMRPFSAIVMELLSMAVPIARGVATGKWVSADKLDAQQKSDLLRLWDEATAQLNELWPTIPPHRFQETDTAFGQWTMPGYEMILYAIDNEVHHRGQGYVYLRSLGITPPQFYERS